MGYPPEKQRKIRRKLQCPCRERPPVLNDHCHLGGYFIQVPLCDCSVAFGKIVDSLRAKFFRGNINRYLCFMSFLQTDMP